MVLHIKMSCFVKYLNLKLEKKRKTNTRKKNLKNYFNYMLYVNDCHFRDFAGLDLFIKN